MPKIYQPAEDSYFLSEVLKSQIKNKNLKCLDMGSGSGIQVQTLIDLGIAPKNITLVDINKKSIKHLKKNFSDSKVVQSDLFKKIKGKFDLIIFNPPYLPQNKFDKNKDTTGGKKGSEVINEFLKHAQKHLEKNGKIFLLTSSFTEGIDFLDYKKKLLAKKKLFFEEIYVWEVCLQDY